jgi:hypothetical protein
MVAKMFPLLKLLCQLLLGPSFGFDTKQRNSFLIEFGVFYNKIKIQTILIIIKFKVFSVFGAHNQQVFCMFERGK